MQYNGASFRLFPDGVIQPASADFVERRAFIKNGTLTSISEYEQKVTRWDDLPQSGTLLETDWPVLDWAFRIARRDLESNFNDEGMSAGTNFQGAATWVRDTSLTAIMGGAGFYPAKMERTMKQLLDEDLHEIQFEQYRGYFEDRYFTMTDQILWVLAVEKLSRVTGNYDLFRHGTAYALRTVSRMLRERFDPVTGLFAGGSLLFDGHSGFTKGMTGPFLRSCSTNLLYMHAFGIFEKLPWLDHETRETFSVLKKDLMAAMDKELWLEDHGYYAHFQFKDNYREERLESLGNIFALGSGDIPADKAKRIAAAMPAFKYGLPALYPWYRERIWYHSGGIWPLMMGMAMWARRERGDDLTENDCSGTGTGLDYIAGQLLRTSMLEQTFMELLYCSTGQGHYSPAQIWSTGALFSLVEYGMFGMKFTDTDLTFKPALPSFMAGSTVRLKDFEIRGRKVTLEMKDGAVSVDGTVLTDNTLPLDTGGYTALDKKNDVIRVPDDISLARPGRDGGSAPASGNKAGSGTLKLSVTPGNITVFPAEEQIGSYKCEVLVTNSGSDVWSGALEITCNEPLLSVSANDAELTAAPGSTVSACFRIGFSEPPVNLAGAEVRVRLTGTDCVAAVSIKRLLTLDLTWRVRPQYIQKSLSFERDFRNFDTWAKLRVPMHAEERLGPFRGVMWYAKRSVIPGAWKGKDLVFYCGAMSEWDRTYINGTEIGRTGDEKNPANGRERRYPIPAEAVKYGAVNNIAVQVWCNKKDCGIWKGPVVIAPADDIEWAIAAGQRVTDDNFFPKTVETSQGNA